MGVIAASLLAIGALGVFSGICWMLDAFGESNENLRRTSNWFTLIAYLIIVALLAVSGIDVVDNAFNNNPPVYAMLPLIAYGPVLLGAVAAVRRWFMPSERRRAAAQLAAVRGPAAYIVFAVIIYSVLTSYGPKEWESFNDWKVFWAWRSR